MHGLVFAVLGDIAARLLAARLLAARLLAVAERSPHVGFGILLLFVIFEAGFTVAAYLMAAPVLHALTWPAVLVANLLAAAVMGAYLWRRHPALHVEP